MCGDRRVGLVRVRVRAASAACCETVAGFEVVCDCTAVIAFATATGAIAHPIRQPVMA